MAEGRRPREEYFPWIVRSLVAIGLGGAAVSGYYIAKDISAAQQEQKAGIAAQAAGFDTEAADHFADQQVEQHDAATVAISATCCLVPIGALAGGLHLIDSALRPSRIKQDAHQTPYLEHQK